MDSKILGYTKNGKPIFAAPKGTIQTAAFILCSKCRVAIRSTGGPQYGSVCVACHDAENFTLCSKCGVDRSVEPCQRQHVQLTDPCPFTGVAQ